MKNDQIIDVEFVKRQEGANRPHMVLVDDDPLFGHLLEYVAKSQRIHLTVISSPEEAYRILPSLKFDVGLFDFDLGKATGIQLCNYLQREGQKVPIMLLSQYGEIDNWRWPISVKRSVEKKIGPLSILTLAMQIYQENETQEESYAGRLQ